jgi:16S rRNA (adenine1518-N6/adenine1519-N6)-dimethyltransferase
VTHSGPRIAQLLRDSNMSPRRQFGQNFVTDPNTVRRIAQMAKISAEDHVVEIGAGLGSLTLALAEVAGPIGVDITAIEVDRGLVPILREVVEQDQLAHPTRTGRVTVVEADATQIDWNALLTPSRSHVMVANLPYNIATPLICDLLDEVPQITRMLVMVQREVAQRFAATAGSQHYGAVSVKIAYWGTARLMGDVPASVFHPRPNVESALVEIIRRDPPAGVTPGPLFRLVSTAFGQRRKMLRRSLADLVSAEQFALAGVSPTDRPEDLALEAWCRLTRIVHESPVGDEDSTGSAS